MFLLINTTAAIALIVLSSVVLLRNSRTELNKSFAVFAVSVAGWVISNFFSNVESMSLEYVSWANHLLFLFSCLSLIVLNHFLLTLVKSRFSVYRKKISTIFALISLLALTPYVVSGVTFEGGVSVIEFGVLTPLYFLVFALSAGMIFQSLVVGMRTASGLEKQRIKVIFYGALATIGISTITNAILPAVFNSYTLIDVGPLSTLILIFALVYVITKHKLFDIRLILARSATYLLLVAVAVAIYVATVFIITRILFTATNSRAWEDIVPLMAALIVITTAPYLKRYFDKITNRLFYRDAYDPQAFLDRLNKTVISNIETGILLRHSAQVIEENIKCEQVYFCLFDSSTHAPRYIGRHLKKPSSPDIQKIKKLTHISVKMIDTDDLEAENPQLHELLVKNNIALLARLQSEVSASEEPLGYMILGPKKSGNRYSTQDIKILEIIADELVIAIQNALRFEEIQNFSLTLQEKVDDATKKVRRTNEKLKELDATKDDFISMASHQLRTPLTSVKGYLSMLVEGDVGKLAPKQQEMLEQAYVSSQRMTYLISDLLNVSRLKSGRFVIERSPTDLATVVEQEVSQLVQAAKARDLTLTYKKPADFPVLMLDETKSRQIIMNFIDNAIYYTPQGGTIEVQVVDKPRSVEFLVTDTGLGVPKRDQPRLFTKFYRANNAKKARPDGTGLGLFMAKKVVIAQGGAVIFKSQEGKGSTFGFTFPKNKLLTEGESTTNSSQNVSKS